MSWWFRDKLMFYGTVLKLWLILWCFGLIYCSASNIWGYLFLSRHSCQLVALEDFVISVILMNGKLYHFCFGFPLTANNSEKKNVTCVDYSNSYLCIMCFKKIFFHIPCLFFCWVFFFLINYRSSLCILNKNPICVC